MGISKHEKLERNFDVVHSLQNLYHFLPHNSKAREKILKTVPVILKTILKDEKTKHDIAETVVHITKNGYLKEDKTTWLNEIETIYRVAGMKFKMPEINMGTIGKKTKKQ